MQMMRMLSLPTFTIVSKGNGIKIQNTADVPILTMEQALLSLAHHK